MTNFETRTFRPRAGFRHALVAGLLAAALAAAGCGEEGTPITPGTPLPPLSRVVISLQGDTLVTGDTLVVNDTEMFTATVYDSGNAVVVTSPAWTTMNSAVFSVTSNGLVTGRAEGSAWMFASAGNVKDSVYVLVLPSSSGWAQQISNSSRKLNGVFFLPDGRGGCVVGDGGEILTTGNAGGTWTRRVSNTSFNLNDVWFTSAAEGWAVGNAGTILHTTNGGTNWSLVLSGAGENLRSVTFAHPDTGWAVGTAGAVLRTVNHGATWQKQNLTAFPLNSVAFSDTRNGWAVGDNGVVYGTVDRGLNWTLLSPAVTSQPLRAVSARSYFENWAAGAQGVLIRSFDNSGSLDFELRSVGAGWELYGLWFPDGQVGFACGVNGTGVVGRTDDGGVTWTPQVVPNGTPLNAIYFVDSFRGWVVGDNGRILHTGSGGNP